jgi:hypothetical protein
MRVAQALPGHPHTTCPAALRRWLAFDRPGVLLLTRYGVVGVVPVSGLTSFSPSIAAVFGPSRGSR